MACAAWCARPESRASEQGSRSELPRAELRESRASRAGLSEHSSRSRAELREQSSGEQSAESSESRAPRAELRRAERGELLGRADLRERAPESRTTEGSAPKRGLQGAELPSECARCGPLDVGTSPHIGAQ
eukprot:15473037-Alexandrium_andersonii.AAC.1